MKVRVPLEVLFDSLAQDAETQNEAIATAIYLVRSGSVEVTETATKAPIGLDSPILDAAA